jgi:hypothetical protein
VEKKYQIVASKVIKAFGVPDRKAHKAQYVVGQFRQADPDIFANLYFSQNTDVI